jgi:hypothetical protein
MDQLEQAKLHREVNQQARNDPMDHWLAEVALKHITGTFGTHTSVTDATQVHLDKQV